MWLVQPSCSVNCCSLHQFYLLVVGAEANLRCGVFFSKKIVVTVLAVFLSFCSWLPDLPWVFISLKDRASFLRLIRHFFFVNATQECLIFDFSFSVESCLFMCLSVMRFFSSQVLPFLITVSGWCYHFDVLIFFFISSILLGLWSLH